MNIMINGTPHELAGPGTVEHLLNSLEIVPEHVAIMVNDRIIPKAVRSGSELKEGDHVEILTFMGGG